MIFISRQEICIVYGSRRLLLEDGSSKDMSCVKQRYYCPLGFFFSSPFSYLSVTLSLPLKSVAQSHFWGHLLSSAAFCAATLCMQWKWTSQKGVGVNSFLSVLTRDVDEYKAIYLFHIIISELSNCRLTSTLFFNIFHFFAFFNKQISFSHCTAGLNIFQSGFRPRHTPRLLSWK